MIDTRPKPPACELQRLARDLWLLDVPSCNEPALSTTITIGAEPIPGVLVVSRFALCKQCTIAIAFTHTHLAIEVRR